MLGFYKNFPENINKKMRFNVLLSNKRLQQTLIQTFLEINGKTFNLEDITSPSIPQCKVIFEFGIAETTTFSYIDIEEADRILKAIERKPLQIMDLFCAIRYYKIRNEGKTPLKFDYYMIRFIFNKNLMEIQVFHERGPRYIFPEDIINCIMRELNKIFSKRILKSLEA
jgi:hypothetical protein